MTYYFLDDLGLEIPLKIFDAGSVEGSVPASFQAVMLGLNGRLESPLRWQEQIHAAQRYVAAGHRLLWKIDLGLFSGLGFPISDETQYQALGLALRHFGDAVWSEFKEQTLGICLYRGSVDFSRAMEWDFPLLDRLHAWLKTLFSHFEIFAKETALQASSWDQVDDELMRTTPAGRDLLKLFLRDQAVEYLDLLARHLPGGVPVCVLFDMQGILDRALSAQLLAKEKYAGIVRGVTLGAWPIEALRYDGTSLVSDDSKCDYPEAIPTVGLCLPPGDLPAVTQQLRKAIETLGSMPFRLLSEPFLTSSWQGLETLIVFSEAMTPQSLRKLHGFCAAGGTVATIGPLLGVSQEIAFD